MNTEFIISSTLFHFPLPHNNHVMHVRKNQRKRSTEEERAAETRYRRRETPEDFGSKLKRDGRERPHPDTATRKSVRRNREISGNVKSAEKNPCRNAKTIPHINRPAFFLTDCLPIYSSREKW
ncbi:hypothetical protein [Akkermansia muciniphila]|uniref:hypothetical protein n=1 Tax=Akkermansia muciniphila TaxID=239935 RepID=UPI0015C68E91|nr:hypothetical protein [Akkermansia muciniphila]